MPITIADDLPAIGILQSEGVMIKREAEASRQDIRPLQIALLNLMPTKEVTEIQIARLLGATPLQIQLTLIATGTYTPKNTPLSHLQRFYTTFNQIKSRKFDGLIITGAPVETLDFEKVIYWQELCAILAWAQTHVFRTLSICWGAQAAAYYYRKIPKYQLQAKKFGVYDHQIYNSNHPLMRGFDDIFPCPVSRHTENKTSDFPFQDGDLVQLADSPEAGICLVDDLKNNIVYMFNHLEYDGDTLYREYIRDAENGQLPPEHYFPNDDVHKTPKNRWRSHAHLLFGNWVNMVYQETPFDLDKIGAL